MECSPISFYILTLHASQTQVVLPLSSYLPQAGGGHPCCPLPLSRPLACPLLRGHSCVPGRVTQPCPLSADIVGMAFIDSLGFGSLSFSPLLPPSSFRVTSAPTGWLPDALSCLLLDQVVSMLRFHFPLAIDVISSTMALIPGSATGFSISR